MLGDAGRMGANFILIVGSGLAIYEGARDGNWVQFGFGVGGTVLEVATLGIGSIIKGGIKAIGAELAEEGLEKAAKEGAEVLIKNVDPFTLIRTVYKINGHHRVNAAIRLGQEIPVNKLADPKW